MTANRADKISLKSDVSLNQYSNQLKALKDPKEGMRSPSLGSIQLSPGLKITGLVPQNLDRFLVLPL